MSPARAFTMNRKNVALPRDKRYQLTGRVTELSLNTMKTGEPWLGFRLVLDSGKRVRCVAFADKARALLDLLESLPNTSHHRVRVLGYFERVVYKRPYARLKVIFSAAPSIKKHCLSRARPASSCRRTAA